MNVKQNLVSSGKYNIKCPYTMNAEFMVVHNTANDASAANEVAYMIRNNNQVSFHYAIDDKEIVQGIPENRNSWNAGDGANGKGNRKGIAIEICYSKSGGERFDKAEKLAAQFIASKLKEKGWGIDRVKKHNDFSNKNCPHRTLALGWQRFLDMISAELNESKQTATQATTTKPVTNSNYLANTSYKGSSIAEALKQIGVDSSYAYRAKLASVNGIKNYSGTANQNIQMLNLLKQGKLLKVGATATKPNVIYLANKSYRGVSITQALKEIGADSSFTYRSKLAKKNGISGYTGTAAQNTKMLNLLKQGKLIKA